MTARIVVAAPRAQVAELRAIACCAEHCPDAPRPPMTPHRCCFVDAGASDAATLTSTPASGVASAPVVAVVPGMRTAPRLTTDRVVAVLGSSRAGPPLFLQVSNLRL